MLFTVSTQTEDVDNFTRLCSETVLAQATPIFSHIATQTDALLLKNEPYVNNNNIETCMDCTKCVECEKLRHYANKLEFDIKHKNVTLTEMQSEMDRYEENLDALQKSLDEETKANRKLKILIDEMKSSLDVLGEKCFVGSDTPMPLYSESVQVQTESGNLSEYKLK